MSHPVIDTLAFESRFTSLGYLTDCVSQLLSSYLEPSPSASGFFVLGSTLNHKTLYILASRSRCQLAY